MKEIFPKEFVTDEDANSVYRLMESADFFFVVDTRKRNQVESMSAGKTRADRKKFSKIRDKFNNVVYQAKKELEFFK